MQSRTTMLRCLCLTLTLAISGVIGGCNGEFSTGAEEEADASRPPPKRNNDDEDAGVPAPRDNQDAGPSDNEPAQPQAVEVGPVDVGSRGPLPVATTLTTVLPQGADTPVGVRFWYPAVKAAADEASQARPITALEGDKDTRNLLAGLLEGAPESCVTREMNVAINAEAHPNQDSWPVVLYVPCEGCPGYSSFSVAEQLASWGIVVAAAATPGWLNEGANVPGDADQEAASLVALLDAVFEAPAASLPQGLSGKLDVERVGIWGHGRGATLAAKAFAGDARARAWVLMAPTPANAAQPTYIEVGDGTARSLFVLAREDNVVPESDNIAVRTSFEQAKAESWLLEVSDAGHYSFSDFAGLNPGLSQGCGSGTRQSSAGSFTYLDREVAISLTKAYVLAYFARELLGDEVAREYLKAPRPKGVVTIAHHE